LARHLTAYDLITFHHRGANYPDLLLLDAALKAYVRLAERQRALFVEVPADQETLGLRRRRALRQAWLLRRQYEGHPVPDAPTSPGENARIWPAPHERVTEEQIVDPSRRTKTLFASDPLADHLGPVGRQILRQSIQDLQHPHELRELGMAIFLDRPLGVFKAPTEPDQTLLLSNEAFSRSIAGRRLHDLAARWNSLDDAEERLYQANLQNLKVEGVAPGMPSGRPRPGVSLADAARVADDFIVLRTTARSVRDFLRAFDFSAVRQRFSLDFLSQSKRLLIIRSPAEVRSVEGTLMILDEHLQRRLEFQIDPQTGYFSRGGLECPASGLRLRRLSSLDNAGEWREHQLDVHVATH
jgi:hypothetical protein